MSSWRRPQGSPGTLWRDEVFGLAQADEHLSQALETFCLCWLKNVNISSSS